tara:strand:+ start:224 stop:745 length:522 start_codon:yes stop_codon:yes gene_type:complete
MNFPNTTEYNPAFQKYIELVETDNFFSQFDAITTETVNFFKAINTEKLNYKYAENKWTIKEVLMHIIDTERGFSYRAIVCIRQDDKTPLYGMDEDLYAKNVKITERKIENMLEEFVIVRKGFRILFENCTEDKSKFLGNGIGHEISARALGFISIGHTKHHLNIIKERYLSDN